MQSSAILSEDQRYRYLLTRTWGTGRRHAVFVMLNPSKADANVDDPTIVRCINFAEDWGYDGLRVVNLFAFRATDPRQLETAQFLAINPIGEFNALADAYIKAELDHAWKFDGVVIAAWGAHRMATARGQRVLELLAGQPAYCLGQTKSGAPRHPLYIPAITTPTPWRSAA